MPCPRHLAGSRIPPSQSGIKTKLMPVGFPVTHPQGLRDGQRRG